MNKSIFISILVIMVLVLQFLYLNENHKTIILKKQIEILIESSQDQNKTIDRLIKENTSLNTMIKICKEDLVDLGMTEVDIKYPTLKKYE